ncbi:MAG: hypothetical protein AAF234_02970 [Pseudomonadota bacterium]
MRARIKRLLIALGLVMGIGAGPFGSAVFAQDHGLILPERPSDTIELMQSEAGDPAPLLQVFVGPSDACCDDRSPIAGRYMADKGSVTFDPAFDLVTGQTYTVLTRVTGADALTEFTLVAEGSFANPEVTAIYPSGPVIPENTLRFYIHFSTPMQPHMSVDFISLLDTDGTPDPAAFMTFTQELWNEDRTRLTLLMDPGRIKRGVATNLELGPALLEGQRYSITVAEGWPSANGQQELPRFEQHFLVSASLRELPNTDLWRITQPAARTLDPLLIAFDRPFDHQLAQTSIHVVGPDGQSIPGTVSIEDHERTWRFVPESPWPAQTLDITIDALLEDVAGNNFRDLLDHAVETDVRAIDQITLTLSLSP